MIRRRYVLAVCTCLWASLGGPGLSARAQGPDKAEPIRTVQLTLYPAAEPEYALQYRLDTPYSDRRGGNGALLYDTAVSLLGQIDEDWRKVRDQIQQWYEADPATLPMDEVRGMVSRFQASIHYLDLAGRSEECSWNYPIREEGLRCLVPDLAGDRTLVRVLMLKARMEAADGAMREAIETLRIGLSMARDMGRGPTTTQVVSGLATARGMIAEIERLVQRPDAPNLYWALTALPRPLIDARRALETDVGMIYAEFPQLRDIETRALSEAELADLWSRLQAQAGGLQETLPASMIASAMRIYPEARAELEKGGKTPQEIAALPASQIVLIHQLRQYRRLLDAAFKWNYVPVWQVGDRYLKAEGMVFSGAWLDKAGPVVNALWTVFPQLGRFPFLQVRLERDIAILRCVEALRIYAAGHQAGLPRSLEDVTEVPIPMDPLHGRGFQYRLTGDKAVLESPAPAGGAPKEGLRYEITLKPALDRGRTSR